MAQQVLQPELRKNAIQFDLRKLQVGDFLWVARPKFSGHAFGNKNGQLEEREVVLDYIIERKRMDDLCSSIIDGRFREQKFRLKASGLKQAIYLVEDYGSCQHLSMSEDALYQAITNTQVVDNFFVKRTKDLKESVRYLTLMTRYLQSLYLNKKLVACKKSSLDESKVFNEMENSEHYLLTFKEFSAHTTKNKPLKVTEMFAKQLTLISGLTSEKALGITRAYPTPKIIQQGILPQQLLHVLPHAIKLIKMMSHSTKGLMDALNECDTQKEKETYLETLKWGSSNKNLGKVLAQQVARLYTLETLT